METKDVYILKKGIREVRTISRVVFRAVKQVSTQMVETIDRVKKKQPTVRSIENKKNFLLGVCDNTERIKDQGLLSNYSGKENDLRRLENEYVSYFMNEKTEVRKLRKKQRLFKSVAE